MEALLDYDPIVMNGWSIKFRIARGLPTELLELYRQKSPNEDGRAAEVSDANWYIAWMFIRSVERMARGKKFCRTERLRMG